MNRLIVIEILTAFTIQLLFFLLQLLATTRFKLVVSAILILLFVSLIKQPVFFSVTTVFFLVLFLSIFVYFHLFVKKKMKNLNPKTVRNKTNINFKKMFTQKNMYSRLFITYLNRISIKEYLEYLFFCCLLIIYSRFLKFDVDATPLLFLFTLVDIELLSDRHFKNLNRASAELYFYKNSPVDKNKAYFLSAYFHKALIYVSLGVIGLIFGTSQTFFSILVNFMYLTSIIFLISSLYYKLENKGVRTRKKEINFIIQYLLIVFILASLLVRLYITKY